MRKVLGIAYSKLLKPILFRFDPERVHDFFTFWGMILGRIPILRKLLRQVFSYENTALSQEIVGLHFPNPVGLSAGFDKNASLLNILPSIGFGHAEIGSVTLEAYAGNPKPRLKRLPKSRGLVVYYGLKNIGVEKIIKRIAKFKSQNFALGVSVAKTNCSRTATEAAGIVDYVECLKKLQESGVGDYYTINISCPNTFGGEPYTTPAKLNKLLQAIAKLKTTTPLFVKMPINLEWSDFEMLLEICVQHNIAGVVIGNLTKVRSQETIKDELPDSVKGGISGKPTWELSNELISQTYRKYGKQLVIVGVGGIFTAEDAYEKIRRGSSLVQLITGMIFQGPQLIGEINYGLVKLLQADGYTNISEAVGSYYRG